MLTKKWHQKLFFSLFYRFQSAISNNYQWNRASLKNLNTFAHERIHKIHADYLKITSIIESIQITITNHHYNRAFAMDYHYNVDFRPFV